MASKNQVVILAGQSNAEGTSTTAAGLSGDYLGFDEEFPGVRTAHQVRCNSDSGAAKCDHEWPIHAVQSRQASFGEFGPEIGIARSIPNIQSHAPDGTFIIKCATGGTDLFNNWEPGRVSGFVLYQRMVDFVDDIMAPLGEYEVVMCCWVQGEADAGVENKATSYEANLNNLIANMRSDFSNPDEVFSFLRLHSSYSFGAWADEVRDAQNAVAAADPLAVLVTADDLALNGDGIHYGSNPIAEIGLRLGAAGDALITPCG